MFESYIFLLIFGPFLGPYLSREFGLLNHSEYLLSVEVWCKYWHFWLQLFLRRRIFKTDTFFPLFYVNLSFGVTNYLDNWKTPSHKDALYWVKFGPVVLGKESKMWKLNRETDGRPMYIRWSENINASGELNLKRYI